MRADFTQEELKTLLYYDPDTGSWIWLGSRSRKGKPAGSIQCDIHCGKPIYRHYIKIGHHHKYLASRLAFFYMTGRWPNDQIDHKDGDSLNNRWDNLREATENQNKQNRLMSSSGNLPRGVYFEPNSPNRPYVAHCKANGKRHKTRGFKTPEEAHQAYLDMVKELHQDFAYTNRE